MADTKISALSAAAALTGTETVPVVQSAATVRTTVQDIANLAPAGTAIATGTNSVTTSATGTVINVDPTDSLQVLFGAAGNDVMTLDDNGVVIESSGASGIVLTGDVTSMGTAAGDDYVYVSLSGGVEIGVGSGNKVVTPHITTTSIAVGSLPSAAVVGAGCRAFVNDSTVGLAAGLGDVVVGGSGSLVPVYSDGTDWRIG